MRTHLLLARRVLLALALPVVAAAQVTPPAPPTPRTPRVPRVEPSEHGQRGKFEETDRKTLTVGNVVELDISNMSGDITIGPGNGRNASIEYTRRAFGNTQEEARRQLEMLEVSLNVGGDGRGEIRSRHKVPPGQRERNFHGSVDFRVTAPPQTRIHVKTMSGSIQSSRMKGDLAFETMSGDIRIDGGGRVSLAKTMSGDVEISGVTAEEPLVASSMSGSVTLRSLKARYLEINSVSGDIIMRDVACERADVQTISGNVEYAGSVTRGGRYELKSHSGDVRLVVAGGAGFDVDANSFSGKIRSDLPIKNEAEDEDDMVVSAGGRRVHIPKRAAFVGRYKDGSATIELTTFSGDIVITK
jgi:DUF4097 and DUF4098 domain-containing protein YvlB